MHIHLTYTIIMKEIIVYEQKMGIHFIFIYVVFRIKKTISFKSNADESRKC